METVSLFARKALKGVDSVVWEFEGENAHEECARVQDILEADGIPCHSPTYNANHASITIGKID